MQYMVTGSDGKEYGPTDLATLKQWVAENRLTPNTMLRDFLSGQTLPASQISELFPAESVASSYPRATPSYIPPSTVSNDHGGGALIGVIFRSALGLASFFLVGGLGFIFAGYAMYYAVQCLQSGSKYGIAAVVIAGISLAIVGIGWAMKLSGTHG